MSREFSDYLEQKITARIARLASFVIDDRSTWDLCCDHGLVGLWAWSQYHLPEVHFVDRAPVVIRDLEESLRGRVDTASLYFHPLDATEVELPFESCNVIIAGVGFRAMKRIIDAIFPAHHAHRAIVSVHAEEERVEPSLLALGWRLQETVHVEERGRMRSISVWDG